MSYDNWKLATPPELEEGPEPELHAGFEPGLITAVAYSGRRRFTLTLVRVHYRAEGTAILEELEPPGADGEPRGTRFLDHGTWKIAANDGPATLSVDVLVPEDLDEPDSVIDALQRQLVVAGEDWSIEAFEPLGEAG